VTPEELAVIKARTEAATPGPWAVPVANVFRVIAPEEEHHNPPHGLTPPYPWHIVCKMSDFDGEATDAEFIAHARTDVPALVAEVERLWEALNQSAHVIAFDDDGWSIEHLVECRPHMTRCAYHRAAVEAAKGWDEPPRSPGRYAVNLTPDGALVIGERIEDAA